MLVDTRTLADGQVVSSDVCIIGAGPAGTTLANEFVGHGAIVSLLESGDKKRQPRTQRLSNGEISGALYEPVDQTHLRQLGGTAGHWILKMANKQNGFRYAPLSPVDFEQRDYHPYSGWPLTRVDLNPYYERAHRVCEIGPFRYKPGSWETEGLKALPLNPERVVTNYFAFGPTRVFTHDFPARFAESGSVHVYLNATVVELLADDTGRIIESAIVRTLEGKVIRFVARQFVVAAGGYGSPRLLLASRGKSPRGIGNEYDQVGRYYMDHSLVPSGNFYPHDPRFINEMGLYDLRDVGGNSVLGKLQIADAAARKEGLRSFTATLFPMPKQSDVDALLGLRAIVVAIKERKFPENLLRSLVQILRGLPHVIRVLYQVLVHNAPLMPGFGQGGWSRLKDNHKKYHRLELLAFVEQSPSPDNRITLLEECDELGCPRIKAHFTWDEADLASIKRSQQIMAEELTATGLGTFEPASDNGCPIIGALGLHHLMGTTRMSDDPAQGVVDRDCKVHGVDNLYIASSSVFATGGHANPTLTILALAIRIADKLKSA